MRARLADLPVFDLYSFYLEPGTDVSTFAPAMELGASFGAKYATVMGADTDWSRQRDNFIKTCDLARQFGLICSLEFAVIRPLATLPQTVRLIEESKRDAVICIDPLHLARSGGTPAEVQALPAKYFPYAQISDGVLEPGEPNPALFGKLGMGTRLMPGEGTLPLRALLAALPRDVTMLIIEHDMDVVFSLADRITVLHHGEVLAEGTPEAVRSDARVYEVYLGTGDDGGGG
jgi:sugar phosphate isomerase/epimerase